MPLHPAAVRALQDLRREPVIDRRVFPVRGSTNPASRISHLFAELCVKAGLTETVERDGKAVVKNPWSLHDLRRKANTDLRNHGAWAKERAALLGHRTTAVNEAHYEALLPSRERGLIDSLETFGMTA
jgi:integrase